ncbi:MAG: DUF222 domain-containing protein [Acidimicrobiia bacterium]
MFEGTTYSETTQTGDVIEDQVAAFEALLDAEEEVVQRILAEWETQLPEDLETVPADHRLAELLCFYEPDRLSDVDRIRYLKASERMVAALQARSLQAIGSIHQSYRALELGDAKDTYDGATFELRGALRWTRRTAENELDFATDLTVRLPAVLALLRAGEIDRRRAKVIVDRTIHLSVAHARLVADEVIEDAARLTTGQLAARIRRAALDVDPESCREETRKAREQRLFFTQPEPDGTASIHLYGVDALRAQELSERINDIARRLRGEGETRTMDQLRADIAVDLLCGTSSPTIGKVHLTVSLTDLFDPDAAAAADLAGYGPILDDIVRQVGESGLGSWEWTVIDPKSGMPVADGHTRRRHTASQRRRLAARHTTCVAPGCRMPTIGCDLDHSTPYSESGFTRTEDSAPLCRHDHCVRHQTGWTYTHLPNGDIVWKSPLGTTYTTSGRDP